MTNDDQLREQAQQAAAELNLELPKSTRLEVARILVRRMKETMQGLQLGAQ